MLRKAKSIVCFYKRKYSNAIYWQSLHFTFIPIFYEANDFYYNQLCECFKKNKPKLFQRQRPSKECHKKKLYLLSTIHFYDFRWFCKLSSIPLLEKTRDSSASVFEYFMAQVDLNLENPCTILSNAIVLASNICVLTSSTLVRFFYIDFSFYKTLFVKKNKCNLKRSHLNSQLTNYIIIHTELDFSS